MNARNTQYPPLAELPTWIIKLEHEALSHRATAAWRRSPNADASRLRDPHFAAQTRAFEEAAERAEHTAAEYRRRLADANSNA